MADPSKRILNIGTDIPEGPDVLRKRAQEQTLELNKEMKAWLDGAVPLTFHLDPSGHVLIATLPAQPAPNLQRWGVLLAGALNTYRSALNGLVSQLARLDGAVPLKPKQVQFPIARTEKEWNDAIKNMESLPPFVVDRLRLTQPFTNPPSPHMLEVISGLDNPAKHDGVLIEAHAIPLALEATGLQLLVNGGTMNMSVYTGPLDFTTDLEVFRWEFSNPVQLSGTPKPSFGIQLLADYDGGNIELLDVIEGPPVIVDAIFSTLLTGV